MAERATVFQVVQIGVESTAGASVAANKKLTALSIEPSIQAEVNTFRPMGTKFQTLASLGKEWTSASLAGMATYTELVYPLSSVLDTATVTAYGTSPNHYYQWVFEPDADGADAPKTFTVQQGDATRAHQFSYLLVTDFSMTFTRDNVELAGTALGQQITDNISLTGSPTTIALEPVLPVDVCVYLDTTYGGLGGTKLTRLMSATWSIANRYGPLWVLDCAEDSFVETVELEPQLTGTLLVEANSQGMGLLTKLRTGDAIWLRHVATSSEAINTGPGVYKLQIDTKAFITGVSEFRDEDGVYAVEWTWTATPETNWAGPTKWTVSNGLSAL
jgi:hypothetical protein